MRLKSNCTICDKELIIRSETDLGELGFLRSYKCGHSFLKSISTGEPIVSKNEFNSESLNGQKAAFPFQVEGLDFIKKSGYNCIVADPMGLGKTIQALLAAREARTADGLPKFKTILAVVKPATAYQWYEESKEWFSADLWSAFLIKGTKAFVPPGFRLYILSMDTLGRKGMLELLKSLNIDLVIVDECHSFKNPESARAQALVSFLQEISQTETEREVTLTCNLCTPREGKENELTVTNGDNFNGTWTEVTKVKLNIQNRTQGTVSYRHESKCPRCGSRIAVYQDRAMLDEREKHSKGLIMLSGTPIKNRADEYFVPLNMLRPDLFSSLSYFRSNWLQQDSKGKYSRINPYRLDRFRELTKSFIIRREKNAVLSLPPFRRTFETIYIEDESIKLAYNAALNNLKVTAESHSNLNFFDINDNLMTLRRITGMGKVPFAVEYINTFLDTTEDEKIAIGVHHESVRDALYNAFVSRDIPCLKLSGEDNAEQKNRIVKRFQDPTGPRVLVVNILAGGVGLNLQACNNVLVLERQWNAADEEQFEGRFWRQGQTLPVLCEYMLAKGTIDTYFSAMVEQKRKVCGEALDGWNFTADDDAIRELIEKTLASKL